ncbi:Inner nuclear membrane protein Man1 [Aphelenchoides fujianensis]|nr:Inner nuclear membrane protein Man1 [Aphelenchoides fujianensis]
MKSPADLTAAELKGELAEFGFKVGPVVEATRSFYEKKLAAFRSGNSSAASSRRSSATSRPTPPSPRTPSPRTPSPRKSPARKASPHNASPRNDTARHEPPPDEPQPPARSSTAGRKPSPHKSALRGDSPRTTPNASPRASTRSSTAFRNDSPPSHTPSPRISTTRQPPAPRSSAFNGSPWSSSSLWNSSSANTSTVRSRLPSERGVYGTPGGRASPPINRHRLQQFQQASGWGDVSKWVMICFASFTIILVLAYLFTAHPKTVERGRRILFGTISDTLAFFYNYAVLPVLLTVVGKFLLFELILGALLFVPFLYYKKRKLTRARFERQTMELVDKIADRVREAGTGGIAEQHIRDAIMPPTRRTEADWTLWQSAVEFINSQDSRMRSENRVINGVECNVWVWANAHDLSQGYAGLVERSPQAHHAPTLALTRCLKIRGLIDSNRSEDDLVRREVYEKLRPVVPVHFSIFRGNESCVYLMFRELSEAKKAFDAFHTQWIRGNLVNVKYVRDERYAERFPEVSL